MQSAMTSRVIDFVWGREPDLALEVGRLPPVLWEDLSRPARQNACAEAEVLIDRLETQPSKPDDAFPTARYHLVSVAASAASPDLGVLNHMTGPAARLSWSARSWPAAADPDCSIYIERLKAFPGYCSTLLNMISEIDLPHTRGSRPVLEAFVDQVDALGAAHRSGADPLLRPVAAARTNGNHVVCPAGLPEEVLEGLSRLRRAARAAMPSAWAASPWPHIDDGEKRYAQAIYRNTSLSCTTRELEDLGRQLLALSESRFRQLLEDVRVIRSSPKTGGQILEEFHITAAGLVARLPAITRVQPRMDFEVVPMPAAHAQVGPPAYYGPSSLSNFRKGVLYVNTREPVATRGWEVLPLAMHEGVPGHHLQLALVDENDTIEDLQRLLPVNGFVEGWAVYAETLAPAMGLELTPLEEFGLLAHQRWRAARLVVDVGLHRRGWNVGQAVEFMAAQTLQDPKVVRREIVRYLAWPGQALGYAVGAKVIASWVESRLRAGLDLIEAHSEVLGRGSLPLTVLVDESGETPVMTAPTHASGSGDQSQG